MIKRYLYASLKLWLKKLCGGEVFPGIYIGGQLRQLFLMISGLIVLGPNQKRIRVSNFEVAVLRTSTTPIAKRELNTCEYCQRKLIVLGEQLYEHETTQVPDCPFILFYFKYYQEGLLYCEESLLKMNPGHYKRPNPI